MSDQHSLLGGPYCVLNRRRSPRFAFKRSHLDVPTPSARHSPRWHTRIPQIAKRGRLRKLLASPCRWRRPDITISCAVALQFHAARNSCASACAYSRTTRRHSSLQSFRQHSLPRPARWRIFLCNSARLVTSIRPPMSPPGGSSLSTFARLDCPTTRSPPGSSADETRSSTLRVSRAP